MKMGAPASSGTNVTDRGAVGVGPVTKKKASRLLPTASVPTSNLLGETVSRPPPPLMPPAPPPTPPTPPTPPSARPPMPPLPGTAGGLSAAASGTGTPPSGSAQTPTPHSPEQHSPLLAHTSPFARQAVSES